MEMLGRGFAWFDTGTHESLMDAGQFVQTVEQRQGFKVACLEEIAFNNGWMSGEQLLDKAETLHKTAYGQYLMQIAKSA
jgi:glucose-1-phosphate thymidylyltransferase